jgi:hypothetical protein
LAGLVTAGAKLAVSMGSDENGKRYQLLINRPAQLMIWLTDFILTIQSFFFSIPVAIRLQLRCNPDSAGMVRIHFFL